MSSGEWTNADGLNIKFGTDRGVNFQYGGQVVTAGAKEQLVFEFDYTTLPSFTSDLNNDGTKNGFTIQDASIPAGATIVSAELKVDTAWASGTDLTVGTYQVDGTVIDADGFITAANGAVANLLAGALITGSGADIATLASAANDAYVVVAANGTFTAGSGKLIITYIR